MVSLEIIVESDLPLCSAVLTSEAAAWASLLSTSLDIVCALFYTKHAIKRWIPLPREPGTGTGALSQQRLVQ